MQRERVNLMERSVLAAYRLGARVVFGNPDQGEWIFEKIRRPRTIATAAMNVVYYKLKIPRVWGLVSVLIEPVFGCNLRCRYCWGSGAIQAKRPHLMSEDVFRRAIDHLPRTVESVTFSLVGEPLLNPNLGDMIDYAHRKGRRVLIFTNGTKLSGERLRMVAESPVSVVNISIEPDAETCREIRGADLDEIRTNVSEFQRLKRPETQIRASCVVTPENVKHLPKIRAYWDGLISQFKFAPCFYEFGDEPPTMCLEMWRGNFNILTSGDVSLCCFDPNAELIVGNVLETDMPEIVNGPAMRKMLSGMTNGRPPARCLRCRQFETSVAPLRAPKE
ncbi:MAG: radical SAM protein [Phycisphaerae bacterium]|nr:radical SAM protein [Phycisphaerae bacterium]